VPIIIRMAVEIIYYRDGLVLLEERYKFLVECKLCWNDIVEAHQTPSVTGHSGWLEDNRGW